MSVQSSTRSAAATAAYLLVPGARADVQALAVLPFENLGAPDDEYFAAGVTEEIIGRLASTCYSYYGFQMDPAELLERTMPDVAGQMQAENIEAVLLTPA